MNWCRRKWFISILVVVSSAAGGNENDGKVSAVNGFQTTIVLTASEKSWLQLRDATGEVLFSGLLWPGKRIVKSTVAPVKLLLGNAHAVRIEYGDNRIDPSQFWSGRVLHMVIGAQPVTSRVSVMSQGNNSKNSVLELAFREDSWIDVRDKMGRKLASSFGKAGETLHVQGLAPLNLLLGNPHGVDAVFQGGEVELFGTERSGPSRLLLGQISNREMERFYFTLSLDDEADEGSRSPKKATGRKLQEGSSEQIVQPGGAFSNSERLALLAWTRDPEDWFDTPPSGGQLFNLPDDASGDGELPSYPHTVISNDFNIEYNSKVKAEDKKDEFEDWLINIESDAAYYFGPRYFLKTDLRFVLEGEDDGLFRYNTGFPDKGIYVQELMLQRGIDRYSFFGGKYEPAASIRGYSPIYFGNYSNDLDLQERMGVGASIYLSRDEESENKLSVHSFFLDTTSLSGELIGGGARSGTSGVREVGDTGRLNNYLLTFNGGSTGWVPGIRYAGGYGEQKGEARLLSERAAFASFFDVIPFSESGNLELSLEVLNLENAKGYAEDSESVTSGIAYSDWPLFLGATYSVRWRMPGGRRDTIAELVVRKGLAESLNLELGLQHSEEDNQEEILFGAVLRYSTDWDSR